MHRIGLKMHRIGLKRHRIGLKRHRIGLKRHRIGLKRHRIGLKRHRIGLKKHRIGLKKHRIGLSTRLAIDRSICILTRPVVNTGFNRSLLVDWWSIEKCEDTKHVSYPLLLDSINRLKIVSI